MIFHGNRKEELFSFQSLCFPWLNSTQEAAVNQVLRAKDVAIIHGPPGTGKTNATDCRTQDVEAQCIHSGEVYCRAEQTLNCKRSQGGKVLYKGKPRVTYSENAPQKL